MEIEANGDRIPYIDWLRCLTNGTLTNRAGVRAHSTKTEFEIIVVQRKPCNKLVHFYKVSPRSRSCIPPSDYNHVWGGEEDMTPHTGLYTTTLYYDISIL